MQRGFGETSIYTHVLPTTRDSVHHVRTSLTHVCHPSNRSGDPPYRLKDERPPLMYPLGHEGSVGRYHIVNYVRYRPSPERRRVEVPAALTLGVAIAVNSNVIELSFGYSQIIKLALLALRVVHARFVSSRMHAVVRW
ncbi:hypothetical protein Trydic_g12548 [Trypoxylus dichotomus]